MVGGQTAIVPCTAMDENMVDLGACMIFACYLCYLCVCVLCVFRVLYVFLRVVLCVFVCVLRVVCIFVCCVCFCACFVFVYFVCCAWKIQRKKLWLARGKSIEGLWTCVYFWRSSKKWLAARR